MVLDAASALGAMTGARFIESLKDGREVWLDGDKVQDVISFSSERSGVPMRLPDGEEIISSVIDLRLSKMN